MEIIYHSFLAIQGALLYNVHSVSPQEHSSSIPLEYGCWAWLFFKLSLICSNIYSLTWRYILVTCMPQYSCTSSFNECPYFAVFLQFWTKEPCSIICFILCSPASAWSLHWVSWSGFFLWFFELICSFSAPQDLVYVVLSQPNVFHAQKAEAVRIHFDDQFADEPKVKLVLYFLYNVFLWNDFGLIFVIQPSLLLLHEKWGDLLGAWTVLPILLE